MSFAVQDFAGKYGTGESDQQVLEKTQSGWTELLPNANIIFSPRSHPQKHRLTQPRTVCVDGLKETFCPKPILEWRKRYFVARENYGTEITDVVGIVVAPSAKL